MKSLWIFAVAIIGFQVFETNAQIDGDYNLWTNQTNTRLSVSKIAYIKSINEIVANFINIQNTFITTQTYYIDVFLYYYPAYFETNDYKFLIYQKTFLVQYRNKELMLDSSSANITAKANATYTSFYSKLETAVLGQFDEVKRAIAAKPSAVSCYESRKKGFFDIASANITNLEKLITNATIALQKRVTDMQNDINIENQELRYDLWYRLYYPTSYGCSTAKECITAYRNAKMLPMLLKIDRRYAEFNSAILQIQLDVQTYAEQQIAVEVPAKLLPIRNAMTACISSY